MMNSLAGMVPGRQLLAGSLLMATRQHFLTVPVFFRLLLDSNTGLLALLQFMVLVKIFELSGKLLREESSSPGLREIGIPSTGYAVITAEPFRKGGW